MPESFYQASNFTINGLNQTDIRINLEKRKNKAFKTLQKHAIPGASHNSMERYDAPKCHPETRKAVLSNIKSWAESNDESTKIMWLNGPAGAGKSSIAQTVATDYHSEGKLAASFFFSRLSALRNEKDGLVATIAYQLSISFPAAKEFIVDNVERDPKIFQSDMKTQIQSLCQKN